jgi:hypothetical protein
MYFFFGPLEKLATNGESLDEVKKKHECIKILNKKFIYGLFKINSHNFIKFFKIILFNSVF